MSLQSSVLKEVKDLAHKLDSIMKREISRISILQECPLLQLDTKLSPDRNFHQFFMH